MQDFWGSVFQSTKYEHQHLYESFRAEGRDFIDQQGQNLLMVYLQHSNLDLAVVELIIAQNNDVNLKSKADWSPLMYSVINPSVTIAVLELLVKSGADLHYQNKFQRNVLSVLISRISFNPTIFQYLVTKNVMMTTPSKQHILQNESPIEDYFMNDVQYLVHQFRFIGQSKNVRMNKKVLRLSFLYCDINTLPSKQLKFLDEVSSYLAVVNDAIQERQHRFIVLFYFRGKLSTRFGKVPSGMFCEFNKYII